jgi:hypothetical protein
VACNDTGLVAKRTAASSISRAMNREAAPDEITHAGLSCTLHCSDDAMARLVSCGWFHLVGIVHVRCRIYP